MEDALLAKISRLEACNVVPAFKAVLQQTRSALQPSNKAAAPTHVRPSQGPDVDRRALASGLLALLQHAGTLAVVDPSLRSALLVEVVEGLRQQPWLWELFLRRHFSLLLSQPLAAELLVEGIAQLDSAVQARCMASLCGALRRWPGAATPQHAATVLRLRKAALGMVRSCFRIVSHELPGLAPGQPRSLGSLGLALATTSTEVHVALEPHLPSAMQLLLYNSPASGQANAGAVLPSSSAASGVSDGGAESGAASSASADVAESAAVYAATLAAQLCDVEALGRMLSLGETQQPQHGDGQQEGCEGAVRLNERSEQRVHVALHVIPVLVEALCGDPSLAERVGSQGQHGGGHLEGTEESTGGLPSHVTLVSCLLAVRWELCQLLVATAASKPPSKWKPAAWTPATCSALLEAMTAVRATPGPHPNAALVMPPAIVAHGLELMREALPSWLGSGAGGGDRLDPDMVTFLQRVLFLQGACYAGVFQPHAAVEDGPAHHEAMVTAQKLRELLVSGAQAGAKGAGTAGVPCGTGTGGKPKGSRKRQGGRGKDAHEQSAKQLKAGNAEGESDDAVADLLDLLTAPPQAASAGAVQEAPSTTTDALTSTYVHLTSSAPQSDSLPTAQAPHLASAGSIPAATSPAAAKPRKRITPQAMGAAPALPAAAIAHSERVQASGDEPINSAVGADPFAIDPGRSWGTGRVVMASTVDMDDVAREAMWAAYIADKERLVELLGDSSYQEWYDEAAHPALTPHPKPGAGLDSAFDAVFGSAEEAVSPDAGPTLPQSILDAAMAYPWQAALAAALFLVRDAAQKAAADVPAAALEVYGSLATVEQRRSAAAASLRIVDPNHSRNTWLSASKGAEAASASGMLLHYVLQLRQLLQRTSRRTVPPTLEAYLTLAVRALPAALQAEADMPTAASGRGPVLPSAFVGTLVRSFAKYPPLLAGSVNAASGGAIPRLAVVGVPSPEAAAYTAAVLWLAVHPRVKPALPRPEWLLVHVPEATAHPIAAATPAARAAAAAACLPLLMGSLDGLLADMEGESGSAAVLPFLDVCTAAFFCLHHEWEAFKGADGAAPQPALLLGSSSSELDHASLITSLMFTLGASADKLASLLDAGGDSGCGLLAAEALAGCLAVGLEFVDVLQPLPNLLRQIGSETYSDHGPKHHAAAQALETALEKAEGSQASCLELLRTLPEDGPAYVAAARGLETAPGLCLPADANFGGDEAAKEDGMAQAKQQGNGEGHLASGDGPARSTRGLTAYQRRKRLQDIRNPYLRAIVAESRRAAGDAADGDLSDLEDFIVTNPERDYGEFIADHFPMAPESDEGESGDEDDEG